MQMLKHGDRLVNRWNCRFTIRTFLKRSTGSSMDDLYWIMSYDHRCRRSNRRSIRWDVYRLSFLDRIRSLIRLSRRSSLDHRVGFPDPPWTHHFALQFFLVPRFHHRGVRPFPTHFSATSNLVTDSGWIFVVGLHSVPFDLVIHGLGESLPSSKVSHPFFKFVSSSSYPSHQDGSSIMDVMNKPSRSSPNIIVVVIWMIH